MNKSDLIARMTERLSGDRTAAVAAVNGVLEEIEGSVARGERVSLTGFGTFDRRERAPRTGRNPRTGEAIAVSASVVPVFRAGTGFRALLAEANGVSSSPEPAAVDGRVPSAAGQKSQAASPDGAVVVAAEAPAGKKAGKKARAQAAEKGDKGSRKAGKGKAGKKAAKDLR